MCPACLTTAALMLAGATTTGGVTAVLVKKLIRSKRGMKLTSPSSSNSQKEKAS
jgi:hypothetical protein